MEDLWGVAITQPADIITKLEGNLVCKGKKNMFTVQATKLNKSPTKMLTLFGGYPS